MALKTRRGRAVALWSAALGLAVFGSVGIAFKDRIVEEWHVWRFDCASAEQKWALAEKLGSFGVKARVTAEDWYISKLSTGTEEESVIAAKKLREMSSLRAVPYLLETQGTEGFRNFAWVLKPMVSERKQTVLPVLVEALKSESLLTAGEASDLLAGLGQDALPALIRGLKDKNSHIRSWSAYTLGRLGSEATPALPALRTAMEDTHTEVRTESEKALKRIERK